MSRTEWVARGWLVIACMMIWGVGSGGASVSEAGVPPSRSACITQCNEQYLASRRYCMDTLAKRPEKRAWYDDCLKNADRFRADCLRRCR